MRNAALGIPHMTELTKKQNALIFALIGVCYILFRVWGMADSCLWFDEIFSVHAAEHPWDTTISFVAKDIIHPPLFYLALKCWISVGGESLFWLRLLPLTFSVLALFPFWMICKETKLKPPAVIVALSLFTVSGSLIKYAQEVRMYGLLLCISLFSIWLFSRFYFRGKNFWLLTVVNILLVYTHYFGWLVVIAEVAAILIAQRIKILRTLLMFGVVLSAFVPWVFAVFRFAESGPGIEQNLGWIGRP
ncbi:MAG: glycosyltransferase family 39 protein, partial [Pyrinomonadaceae bacterium]